MNKNLLNFLIPVIIAGIFIGLYYYWSKRQKYAKPKDTTPEHEEEATKNPLDRFVEVDACVYDNESRTWSFQVIPASIVRKIRQEYNSLGQKRLEDGKWRYSIVRSEGNNYRPLVLPENMKNPPSKLHRALQQQAVAIVYNVTVDSPFLQKWGGALLFAGVCAFIIFMIISRKMQ